MINRKRNCSRARCETSPWRIFPIISLLTLFLLIGSWNCGKKEVTNKEPTQEAEKRMSIAVLYFQNSTPDQNTDWIGKGIAHLIITGLSQSPRLDVLQSSRLETILRVMELPATAVMDAAKAKDVAQRAGAEKALFGTYLAGSQNLSIEAQLMDVATGSIIMKKTIEDQGLESLFSLTDQISGTIKKDFGVPVDQDRRIGDLTTSSPEAYRYYVLGREAFSQFNSTDGMIYFNRAVAQDTSFALVYATMAINMYGLGDIPRATWAQGHAKAHIDRLPEAEKLMVLAIEAHLSGQYEEGFQYYDQLLEKVSPDPTIHMALAQLYYAIQDYSSAERIYQQILQQDPKNVTALIMLGLTRLELGLGDLAQSDLEHAIRLQPNTPQAFIVMSRIYAYQGRTEDAELQLIKASELDPKDPWIHNLLGYLYLNYHKAELALKEFQRYAALAPDDPNAHDSMAEGYLRTGNKDMAEKEYLYAIKLKPDFDNPHYMLGMIYHERGETQQAIEMFQKYLQLSPHGPLSKAAEERLEELESQ